MQLPAFKATVVKTAWYQIKNQHIDQWSRPEHSVTNTSFHSHLIFSGARRYSCHSTVWDKWISTRRTKTLRTYYIPHKNELNIDLRALNFKANNRKYRENSVILMWTIIPSCFLIQIPKNRPPKQKWIVSEIAGAQSLRHSQGSNQGNEDTAYGISKSTCRPHIWWVVSSQIYKKLNSIVSLIRKWTKTYIDISQKEDLTRKKINEKTFIIKDRRIQTTMRYHFTNFKTALMEWTR